MNSPMIDSLFEKVVAEIDFSDLAKEIGPDLKKAIKKKLLENVSEDDFSNVIYDIVNSDEVTKALTDHLVKGLKTLKEPVSKAAPAKKKSAPKLVTGLKNKPSASRK